MKSTKVQNPQRKCSAVVETNCLVAEYRIPYRIGPRIIITHAHCAMLIDGLGHQRLASCVIVSGFRAVLDLDTYSIRNLHVICPRCAERAKPGQGKPVLITHIDFFACFHTISLERSHFRKITTLFLLLL